MSLGCLWVQLTPCVCGPGMCEGVEATANEAGDKKVCWQSIGPAFTLKPTRDWMWKVLQQGSRAGVGVRRYEAQVQHRTDSLRTEFT